MIKAQNDPNDPSNAIVVAQVIRFIDPPEDGVVLGIEADHEGGHKRYRFVFPTNLAAEVATGLIDGLAKLGDPLAQSLQEVIRKDKSQTSPDDIQ